MVLCSHCFHKIILYTLVSEFAHHYTQKYIIVLKVNAVLEREIGVSVSLTIGVIRKSPGVDFFSNDLYVVSTAMIVELVIPSNVLGIFQD